MRGIIILDGADGSGKTTLAGAIKDRVEELGHQAMVIHQGKPEQGTCWDVHSSALLDYVEEAFINNKVVIGDRHFLSESIYGRVYRAGSEYPQASRHIDRLMERFRALRVICAPSSEYVTETHGRLRSERFEEYDSGMDQIAELYLALWNGSAWTYRKDSLTNARITCCNAMESSDYLEQLQALGGVADRVGWYHYDVQDQGKDLKGYASYLLNEMQELQDDVPEGLLSPRDWCFTGFPHEHATLLIGDKLSQKNKLNIPFYHNRDSSGFLVEQLHRLFVDESRLVISNINDPMGIETTRELSHICGRVIVMGREAEQTARKYGIRYDARVRHPQHARRFSYHKDDYALELSRAFNGFSGCASEYVGDSHV